MKNKKLLAGATGKHAQQNLSTRPAPCPQEQGPLQNPRLRATPVRLQGALHADCINNGVEKLKFLRASLLPPPWTLTAACADIGCPTTALICSVSTRQTRTGRGRSIQPQRCECVEDCTIEPAMCASSTR